MKKTQWGSFTKPGKGQALSEYGLTIALVGVASIAGLLYFQDQIMALLTGYKMDDPPTVAVAAPPTSPTSPTANNPPATNTPVTGTTLKLADGTVVDLSNYQSNLGQAVETSGANGTTDMLANTLQQLAQTLLKDNKITPAEASMLTDLANRAHDMAATQLFVENIIKTPGMTAQTLSQMPVTYNNATYANVWSIAMGNLGMCNPAEANCYPDDPSQYGGATGTPTLVQTADGMYWGKDTGTFLQTYQSLKSTGVMNDPAVNSFVTQLVNNVSILADTFEYKVLTTTSDDTQVTNFDQNLASDFTNTNGVIICNVGSGTDSGTNCQ